MVPLWACLVVQGVAQTEYTLDGSPTPAEEEMRWLLNRGRFDSRAENTRRGTNYADVPASIFPLAPNQALSRAARNHADDIARTNRFQHETIPGSPYYNASTHPKPYHRMAVEGFYQGGPVAADDHAENINGGYPSASESYLGWWNSTSHRTGMYSSGRGKPREFGYGFVTRPGSTYLHHHVLNLNALGNRHFFTDTIFEDVNGDDTYTVNEGRGGIRVELRVGGALHGVYDNSSASGSFAIPVETIAVGSQVEVWLTNPTGMPVSITIPFGSQRLLPLSLGAGQARLWGAFLKTADSVNVGFRSLVLPAPPVTLIRSGNTVTLSWISLPTHRYQPQWSENLQIWTNLTASPLNGTGGLLTANDTTSAPRRFYQVLVSPAPQP